MANISLYQLTSEQQRIEDLLLENGGELTPEIEDALASNNEALTAKVDGYNHIFRRLEALAAGAKAEKDRLAKLQRSAENAARALKEHLAAVMEAQGIDKLESATCKIGWRHTTSVEVTDADALLKPYAKVIEALKANIPAWVKVEVSISKTALRDAIEAGEALIGAAITDNKSIQIR